MQSVSNTRTSDSFTAHERDWGFKHNPLGLRRGLCLGEPKRVNHCKEISIIQSPLLCSGTRSLNCWQVISS